MDPTARNGVTDTTSTCEPGPCADEFTQSIESPCPYPWRGSYGHADDDRLGDETQVRRIRENNSSARILYNTSFPMAGGRNNGTEPFDVFVAGGDRRFLPRRPTQAVHGPDGRGPRPQSTTSGPLLGLGTRYRAQGPP